MNVYNELVSFGQLCRRQRTNDVRFTPVMLAQAMGLQGRQGLRALCLARGAKPLGKARVTGLDGLEVQKHNALSVDVAHWDAFAEALSAWSPPPKVGRVPTPRVCATTATAALERAIMATRRALSTMEAELAALRAIKSPELPASGQGHSTEN